MATKTQTKDPKDQAAQTEANAIVNDIKALRSQQPKRQK
jgi:hypothetical protein